MKLIASFAAAFSLIAGALLSTAYAAQVFLEQAEKMCALDPAAAIESLRPMIEYQLREPHSPELDAHTPEQLAQQTRDFAIRRCAARMMNDLPAYNLLRSYQGTDLLSGEAWDAWNLACAKQAGSEAPCIKREVEAFASTRGEQDTNPVKSNLLGLCQLVMQMPSQRDDTRICIDAGLKEHPSDEAVNACKFAIKWHSASAGGRAGAK